MREQRKAARLAEKHKIQTQSVKKKAAELRKAQMFLQKRQAASLLCVKIKAQIKQHCANQQQRRQKLLNSLALVNDELTQLQKNIEELELRMQSQ